MMRPLAMALVVSGLASACVHESLWRIAIDGTLMKDGVEIERFFGRDIDSGYREDDTPELRVHDWKVSEGVQFDIELRLEDHRVLEDLEVGNYGYGEDSGQTETTRVPASYHPGSADSLGIVSMGEKEDGDFGPDHEVIDVVFEIKENANGKLFGVFTGEFSDGYSLVDAEFHMTGFGDPRAEKADDDDYSDYSDYGTDSECAYFSDMTPYYNDIQADSLCWTAGLAEACGYADELEYSCANLRQLLESGTGSIGTCPYC